MLREELNPENLAERIAKAKAALRNEIELLKTSSRKTTENGDKMLVSLVGDLYELVSIARADKSGNRLADKVDRYWRISISIAC